MASSDSWFHHFLIKFWIVSFFFIGVAIVAAELISSIHSTYVSLLFEPFLLSNILEKSNQSALLEFHLFS